MPVLLATQEAEAGESLEPRRQKLQRAKIVPLHSSLGDRTRVHLKNKQTSKETNKRTFSAISEEETANSIIFLYFMLQAEV